MLKKKKKKESGGSMGRWGVFVFICRIWNMKKWVEKLEEKKREGENVCCTTNQKAGTHRPRLRVPPSSSSYSTPPPFSLLRESMQIVGSVCGGVWEAQTAEISYSRQGKQASERSGNREGKNSLVCRKEKKGIKRRVFVQWKDLVWKRQFRWSEVQRQADKEHLDQSRHWVTLSNRKLFTVTIS